MSNELRLRLLLADEDATVRLARLLAASQPDPAVVYLGGDLGAGKSTLARAWLRSLGVEGTIRSPTYTLVERYRLGDSEALHLDLYRIGSGAELEFLGLGTGRDHSQIGAAVILQCTQNLQFIFLAVLVHDGDKIGTELIFHGCPS